MIDDSLWRDRFRRRRGEYDPWDWRRERREDRDYDPGDRPPDTDTQPPPGDTPPGDTPTDDGTGYQYAEPDEWGYGSDWLRGMMASYGKPIDVSGIYEPLRAKGMRAYKENVANTLEAAGMGGLRWSTPTMHEVTREGERMEENITLEMARAQIAAEEAGMGRAMGAVNPFIGLGTQRFQAPYQANQWMLQSGLMEQDLIASQMQNQMNPWLAMMLNATAPPGAGAPTYQPGNSIWDMLQNMPWSDILGGGDNFDQSGDIWRGD